MPVAPILAITLLANVSFAPFPSTDPDPFEMTPRQKTLAAQRLVRSATDCVARTVAADPRLKQEGGDKLGDLIVDSIPSCTASVRAMIDGYDRFYGEGAGEAFFSGPYLEILPQAVSRWVEGKQD